MQFILHCTTKSIIYIFLLYCIYIIIYIIKYIIIYIYVYIYIYISIYIWIYIYIKVYIYIIISTISHIDAPVMKLARTFCQESRCSSCPSHLWPDRIQQWLTILRNKNATKPLVKQEKLSKERGDVYIYTVW